MVSLLAEEKYKGSVKDQLSLALHLMVLPFGASEEIVPKIVGIFFLLTTLRPISRDFQCLYRENRAAMLHRRSEIGGIAV